MAAARHVRGQEWMPGVGEDPVHALSAPVQEMEQHDDDRHIASYECKFERPDRLVNRGDRSEEELGACRIRTWDTRIVQRARLGRMQRVERGVAGDEDVRVIAEPLDAAVPEISMNVVVRPRRHPEKRKPPYRGQHEPDDDDALRESLSREELANSQEVCAAGKAQRNDEGRRTQVGEVARADHQCHEHDQAEPVQTMRR